MDRSEKKLERFTNDIMNEVSIKRQEILNNSEQYYNDEFNKKHKEYLEENNKLIQESLKKINKEKNQIISKAITDNNKMLLKKRAELIESVFSKAKDKIRDYTKDSNYYEELVKIIQKNISCIGEGDLEIVISYSDKEYLDSLKQCFPYNIILENKNIEMLGGCKVTNKTLNLFIDDSYAKRLEDQKESFLQTCNIHI